jgi:hypothetical protein
MPCWAAVRRTVIAVPWVALEIADLIYLVSRGRVKWSGLQTGSKMRRLQRCTSAPMSQGWTVPEFEGLRQGVVRKSYLCQLTDSTTVGQSGKGF